VSLVLVGLIWAVVAIRFAARLDTTSTQRWMTSGLLFLVVASTLRDPVLQRLLRGEPGGATVDGALFLLAAPAIILAAAALYLAALCSMGRPVRPRLTFVEAGLCGAVVLAAGAGTIPHGGSMRGDTDWTLLPEVLAFVLLPMGCSVALIHSSLSSLRGKPRPREVVVYGAICALSVLLTLSNIGDLAAAVCSVTGLDSALTRYMAGADQDQVLLYAAGLGAMAAITPVERGLDLLGADRYSRRRKRLQPLWRDLTEACPEIVYLIPPPPSATHRTRYLLHRTIVEIRDSILILSRYATPNPERVTAAVAAEAQAGPPAETLARAVRLARAAAAKRGGETVHGNLVTQRSAAHDLLDETDELLELAGIWPRAKAIAHHGRYAEPGQTGAAITATEAGRAADLRSPSR
jgi:hypothetical protein